MLRFPGSKDFHAYVRSWPQIKRSHVLFSIGDSLALLHHFSNCGGCTSNLTELSRFLDNMLNMSLKPINKVKYHRLSDEIGFSKQKGFANYTQSYIRRQGS